METRGGAAEGRDASLDARIQLHSEGLEGFSESPEARRLAVLEADAELVNTLMWRGYAGPTWTRFAGALAGYAVEVLRAWIGTGRILARCRARGVKGIGEMQILLREDDDALEVAGLVVAAALVSFRERVLIPGKWRPEKGASLKTFFIGHCLFVFPDIYWGWARDTYGPLLEGKIDAEQLALVRAPEPPTLVVAELRRRLPIADGDQVLAVLVEMGFSHNEIATVTSQSRKAVEMKLYRARKAADDGRD